MQYQLAQLNIARFRLPIEDPVNADFVNNLDRVNATAEAQPGFVWRFIETEGENAGADVFGDANVIVNLSVWDDIEQLHQFAYHNETHRSVMRRRREWFERLEFYLVLWWVKAGHQPSAEEAKDRLDKLSANGPTAEAFTFRQTFPPPVT